MELKYRASRNAVSGVMPRFSRAMSLMRGAATRNATAKRMCGQAQRHQEFLTANFAGWMARILFIFLASMVVKI